MNQYPKKTKPFNIRDMNLGRKCLDITIANEEAHFKEANDSHLGWVGHTLTALPAFRVIVNKVLDDYIGNDGAISAEFGAGKFGRLYNFLLPKRIKKRWMQYEINPAYVRNNKRTALYLFWDWRAKVREGSAYSMPLEDSSVELIAGLSSYDSLFHLDKTMREVYRCLRPNGTFIHFQDIIPSDTVLLFEFQERERRGMPLEFNCEFATLYETPFAGLTRKTDMLLGLESVEDGNQMIGAARYLSNKIAKEAEKAGLRVLLNQELDQRLVLPAEEVRKQVGRRWYDQFPKGKNVFESVPHAGNSFEYDPNVPTGMMQVYAMMDVVVAKKRQ